MTECQEQVRSIELFKSYEDLNVISEYPGGTKLYRCDTCKTKYISVEGGSALHQIYGESEKAFHRFFDDDNRLGKHLFSPLDEIGTPEGIYQYPAIVKTKDGKVHEHAVIELETYFWPIAYELDKMRFCSEIVEITPSPEALSLEQRQTIFARTVTQAGASEAVLKNGDTLIHMYYADHFVPPKYGKPSDFEIVKDFPRTTHSFEAVEKTYFYGLRISG